jgi:integrase
MAKRVEKLTAAQVKNAKPKEDGSSQLYSDGGGLFLRASKGADGTVCRTYFFKYTTPERQPNGRHREPSLGLGSADKISLVDVRRLAREADGQRKAAWRDWKPGDPRPATDPVERNRLVSEARKTAHATEKAAKTDVLTLYKAFDGYINEFSSGWKSSKHRDQWIDSTRRFVPPTIGNKPAAEVTRDDVLTIVRPLWGTITETASRLRGRLEVTLDYAGRHDDNPARWASLKYALPKRNKRRSVRHFAALPYSEVGALVAELRAMDTVTSMAIEFAILCASRRGEVLGGGRGGPPPMPWQEVNFDQRLWTIPPGRMKRDKQHEVPLSDRAIQILRRMEEVKSGDVVFPLSPMTAWKALKKLRPNATLHGFRSSFRDWCGDCTEFPRELGEAALSHTVQGVEGDYRRGTAVQKRAVVMQRWADFINQPSGANVVEMPKRDDDKVA